MRTTSIRVYSRELPKCTLPTFDKIAKLHTTDIRFYLAICQSAPNWNPIRIKERVAKVHANDIRY